MNTHAQFYTHLLSNILPISMVHTQKFGIQIADSTVRLLGNQRTERGREESPSYHILSKNRHFFVVQEKKLIQFYFY